MIGAVDMAKNIKFYNFLLPHLKLQTPKNITLNYLIQSNIRYFSSLINKFALETSSTKEIINTSLEQKSSNQNIITPLSDNNLNTYLTGLFEGSVRLFQDNGSSNEKLINDKISSVIKKSRNMKYITDGIDSLPSSTSEILIGLLLGDVHASRASSKNTRFLFEQGEVHNSYLLHLYDLFKDYCKTEPKSSSRFDKRVNKSYLRIKFSTLSSPVFNYYYDLFYLNETKIIPANLGELLTSRSLAYWAMDDGNRVGSGFRLNTQSFTKDENLFLIKVLKDNFDLDCTLQIHSKNLYRIYILSKSMSKFKVLISPYFHESMMYKLNDNDTKDNQTPLLSNNEDSLNTYLSGYFEADGHIWVSNPNVNSKKKHNPRFCIIFHLKDKPLAEKLLESIGYGFIRIKLKENACVLTVSPLKGLMYVIELLNGNMRTPKIHQLYSLIDWVNINHNSNINKLPLSTSPLNNDSWLAGFLDADGSFLIRHSTLETSKKERITCSCVIEQRLVDPKSNEDYFTILDQIANLFSTKLLITNRNYYRINATSLKSINLVINYLEQFNLRGSKYLDSLDWIEAAKIIIDGNHYTLEGKNKIDLLKNRMNRNRIIMNWDHLNKYF